MARRKLVDMIDETDQFDAPMTAPYVPRTELGRRLLALRAEIVRSGVPLLNWDELEREVAERRGGTILQEFDERRTP